MIESGMKMINTLFLCCGLGWGGGGANTRGVQTFHLPYLTFLVPLFSWPPPSSSFLIAKYEAFLHNFPPFLLLPTHSEFPIPPFHFPTPVAVLPGSHLLSFLT